MKKVLACLAAIIVVCTFVVAEAEEIKGVTVVASEDLYRQPDILMLCMLLGAIGTISFMLVNTLRSEFSIFTTILFIVSFITFVVSIATMAIRDPDVYDHTRYYITVNEETPMIEFNERYEIVGEHGSLLEVIEK